MISIGLHVTLLVASQFAGAFLAASAATAICSACGLGQEGWVLFAAGAPSLLLGWWVGGNAFCWFVAARCPRCRERTHREEAESIQYRCQACGHLVVTGIRYEGD